MLRLSNTTAPHWAYYFFSILSAVLVGINCFVVAWHFMSAHQVGSLLTFACALSGLGLNTILYWHGGARKLEKFISSLPGALFSTESIIALSSGMCMFCLTLASYIELKATLSIWQQMVIPFNTLALCFSLANALSTFVLFYGDDPISSKPSKPSSWGNYISLTQKALFSIPKNPSFFLKKIAAWMSAGGQSVLYSMLNYSCIYGLLATMINPNNLFCTAVSTALTIGMLVGELQFNHAVMSKITIRLPTIPHKKRHLSHILSGITISAILLNSFANGWVALGYLSNIPFALTCLIIANGSLVSFAIMKDSINDVFNGATNTKSSTALLPPGRPERTKLARAFSAFLLSCFCGYGILHPGSAMLLSFLPAISTAVATSMVIYITGTSLLHKSITFPKNGCEPIRAGYIRKGIATKHTTVSNPQSQRSWLKALIGQR